MVNEEISFIATIRSHATTYGITIPKEILDSGLLEYKDVVQVRLTKVRGRKNRGY